MVFFLEVLGIILGLQWQKDVDGIIVLPKVRQQASIEPGRE